MTAEPLPPFANLPAQQREASNMQLAKPDKGNNTHAWIELHTNTTSLSYKSKAYISETMGPPELKLGIETHHV